MSDLSKKQKKYLREIANLAHERELSSALKELRLQFESWEKGEIDSYELDHEIHIHHDIVSRGLHKTYEVKDPRIPVAMAVSKNVISIDEINNDYHFLIERLVEFYKDSDQN